MKPPLRFCYRCKKRKSLKAFRTITGLYDPRLCNICRWNKNFTVEEAAARVQRGLSPPSTLKRAVAYRAERYKRRHETAAANRDKEILATWKPVITSGKQARHQLRVFEPRTPEQEEWRREMRELVDEAINLCRNMTEAKPENVLVLWYDVLPPGKARAMVREFPTDGMEQAPLVIL